MKTLARIALIALTTAASLTGAQAAVVTGNIAVYDGVTLLGYVRNTFDSQNSYTYGALANALTVQIDNSGSPFDIVALNGPDAAHTRVGAVGGSGGYNFQAGQLGYAYLSGTGHTNAGSVPSFTAGHSIQALGYNAPAESMIWSLQGDILKSVWVNADGSTSTAQSFYDASVDFVGLVGDFSRFTSTFPTEGARLVTLRFTGDLNQTVPEPATYPLLLVGLAGALLSRRRRA